MVNIKNEITVCHICGGRGFIRETYDGRDYEHHEDSPCYKCEGTGLLRVITTTTIETTYLKHTPQKLKECRRI